MVAPARRSVVASPGGQGRILTLARPAARRGAPEETPTPWPNAYIPRSKPRIVIAGEAAAEIPTTAVVISPSSAVVTANDGNESIGRSL